MKKIISLIIVSMLLATIFLTGYSYATALDALKVEIDKTTVRPGEEVTATVTFGEKLGAYTFDFKYDNNIFEYVSVDGGTANDTSDKVRVTFHDSTGGTNPRENMSIKFRAKADITTSNPTEITVTAEGMANADASVNYDDVTVPIVKNLTVEPEYKDYVIKLEHTGNIEKGVEKEMKLSYSSSMGRHYEHARLIADVTTPKGASVKMLATRAKTRTEQDIIQSGWGDPQGYKIGGKDVSQVLNVRALFSDVGDYTITLKLIDRDTSDNVIAQNTFQYKIAEPVTNNPGQQEPTPEQSVPEAEKPVPESTTPESTIQSGNSNISKPTTLPKTGYNLYVPVFVVIVSLFGLGIFYNKKFNL